MHRWTALSMMVLVIATVIGCSGGGGGPVTPAAEPAITNPTDHTGQSQTHLWGYYDLYFDFESQTVEAVPNREMMFAANVVQFLNSNPASLQFKIWGTPTGVGYVDVDIDVKITHPFPGMSQYNGYDVRGIFIGNGSKVMKYNADLKYAAYGATDQVMYDYDLATGDPYAELTGMPDGYSRWWNPPEFKTPGLFGYTPGRVATPGYTGKATLNPYKYFADTLTPSAGLWGFLTSTAKKGVFSTGMTNARNYYLRFPTPAPGVKYNYAVVANWINATTHPANAPEALACKADVTPDIWYVDPANKGGKLILDVSLFDWDSEVGGSGYMEDYTIWVESTVLTAAYKLNTTEMTPTGGGATYSTYHVEIESNNVTGRENQQFWVVAECADENYVTGVPNTAGSDKLAACFRYDLYVHDKPYNLPPEITSGVDGEAEPIEWTVETYSVTATDPDGNPLTYNWTVTDGNGDPVEDYDGVPGDGAGNLDIDWGEVAGWTQGVTPYDIACEVSDGKAPPVPATTLSVEVCVDGDWWVSNHPDFGSVPDNGTRSEPFSTIAQAFAVYSTGDFIVVDYGTGTYNEQIYRYYSNGFTLRAWSFYTTPPGRPKLTCPTGYPVYVYYTSGVTIQGFRIEYTPTNTSYYLVYAYQSDEFKLIDCHLTGTINFYYIYALYAYYCDNVLVKNCLFSDLNTNYSYVYAYMYLFYMYYGGGQHKFIQNEVTGLQNTYTVPTYMYIYSYAYYWPPGSVFSNNLFHHIEPKTGSYFYAWPFRIYYPYATCAVANNVLDKFSANNTPGISASTNIYPMYLYGMSPTFGYDANSNIVSNMTGTSSMPMYYGIYAYNISPDYNDVWNIQDNPYPSSGPGPNSISADPLFVNNTTAPYDYHLQTGSPCIGTGKAGVDMGCYGNLPEGEVVGLLTPK